MKAGKPIASSSKERRVGVIKDIMRMNKSKVIDSNTELFSYIVFLSAQAMSASEHLDIIKKNKTKRSNWGGEGDYCRPWGRRTNWLSPQLFFDLENIESDYYEIGNPAKFILYFNTLE